MEDEEKAVGHLMIHLLVQRGPIDDEVLAAFAVYSLTEVLP